VDLLGFFGDARAFFQEADHLVDIMYPIEKGHETPAPGSLQHARIDSGSK